MNKENQKKNQELFNKCRADAAKKIDQLKDNLKAEMAPIDDEITELNEALQNAYSTNIIPLQFRNIRGVYHLYDYLSTSNQTL